MQYKAPAAEGHWSIAIRAPEMGRCDAGLRRSGLLMMGSECVLRLVCTGFACRMRRALRGRGVHSSFSKGGRLLRVGSRFGCVLAHERSTLPFSLIFGSAQNLSVMSEGARETDKGGGLRT